jgi:site-specific DNA-methyltransferase (adenine-specific)
MPLINGDCLDVMGLIPDGSVDMVMCDPPYGTTACKYYQIARDRISKEKS